MKARVTTEFPGRPDQEILTRTIMPGEEIAGDLAKVAVANKWAEEISGDTNATKPGKKSGK